MGNLTDAIRRAIRRSEKTRYRIAKESGVSAGQLSRLASGEQGMRVETIETLAAYLGLEVVLRPKRKPKRRK